MRYWDYWESRATPIPVVDLEGSGLDLVMLFGAVLVRPYGHLRENHPGAVGSRWVSEEVE